MSWLRQFVRWVSARLSRIASFIRRFLDENDLWVPFVGYPLGGLCMGAMLRSHPQVDLISAISVIIGAVFGYFGAVDAGRRLTNAIEGAQSLRLGEVLKATRDAAEDRLQVLTELDDLLQNVPEMSVLRNRAARHADKLVELQSADGHLLPNDVRAARRKANRAIAELRVRIDNLTHEPKAALYAAATNNHARKMLIAAEVNDLRTIAKPMVTELLQACAKHLPN